MKREPVAVGLVGPLPPPSGGMANQTRQLARLLAGEGVRVETVQVNPPYCPSWIARWRGVRAVPRLMQYLARLWGVAGRVSVLHVMANSGWSWHLFAAPAIWVGWLRGIPVVVNYRGGDAEMFFGRHFRWVRPSLLRAAAVVVPSGFLKEVFARRGINALTIGNIIDLTKFHPDANSVAADVAGGEWTVVVTRNLEPIYDIATAIRAVHALRGEVPAVRLVIAGTGPELAALVDLAESLGLRQAVEFVGRVDNDAIAGLYRVAHIALNPSLVDNMPNSVLEALACGVPVVTTDVGGVPHLVAHEKQALLVPPGDARAMAAAMQRLLLDRGLSRRLIQAGLVHVRQFSWPFIRDEWIGLYTRLAAGDRVAAGERV